MFWFHIVRETSIRKSLVHSNLLALSFIAAANLVLVHCNTQCYKGINLAVTSNACPTASLRCRQNGGVCSLLCSNSNFLLSVWLSSFSEHVHQLRFQFSALYSHIHILYIHSIYTSTLPWCKRLSWSPKQTYSCSMSRWPWSTCELHPDSLQSICNSRVLLLR